MTSISAPEQVALSPWEESLLRVFQSRQPGIQIATLEEDRALHSLQAVTYVLAKLGLGARDIVRWSTVSCMKYTVVNPEVPKDLDGPQGHLPLEKRLTEWIREPSGNEDGGIPGIFLAADVEPLFERNYGLVRLFRESLDAILHQRLRKTIIILNKDFTLPPELRRDFMRFTLELPDVEGIGTVVQGMFDGIRSKNAEKLAKAHVEPQILRGFSAACSGLTERECRGLFVLSMAKYKAFDERAVVLAQKEKARILLAGGALAMQEPRFGFADVGGLENAKAWAAQVTPILTNPAEARAFGLRVPSGLLLIGIPGGGKSLMSEALAKEWCLPLLRFDVGAAFGSFVGESEKNIRRMIEIANALKPCMVFIDEIEKGFGADSHDGGTTARVKSTLLTWFQDKPDSIFVVATANDLNKLSGMPELIRSGRFDQQFFVDLPDAASRQKIFEIHFCRAGHKVEADTLREAALATPGYSGAEIEVIVQQALRFAFAASPRGLTKGQILRAVAEIKPLSATMAESISRLRAWCHEGRAKPAGAPLEGDSQSASRSAGIGDLLADTGR